MNMIWSRVLNGLLFIILLTPALLADEAAAPAEQNHFLWKVSGKTGHAYLFGTIHLLRASDYPLATPITQALKDADLLILEVDPKAAQNTQVQMQLVQAAMLPDGKELKDVLSAATYALAEEKCEAMGVDVNMFSRMQPWMFAVTLSMYELSKLGFNPQAGVDKHLAARAREAEMPVEGLETALHQIRLLSGLSREQQDAMVRHTIAELDVMRDSIEKMVAAWKTGDSEAVKSFTHDAFREFPRLKKVLLEQRNRQWLPVIRENLAAGKTAFIAVGAAHLVGEDGVVELLREAGYAVEQQ